MHIYSHIIICIYIHICLTKVYRFLKSWLLAWLRFSSSSFCINCFFFFFSKQCWQRNKEMVCHIPIDHQIAITIARNDIYNNNYEYLPFTIEIA